MAQSFNRIPASPQTPAPLKVSLAQPRKGRQSVPFRLALYGVPGVGKSSLANATPAPVFLDCEHGTEQLDVNAAFDVESWPQFMAYLEELRTGQHGFKSVVVDTASSLEKKLWTMLCERKGVASIEDFGFQKGYIAALEHWREALYKLECLRLERRMNVIILDHAVIRPFKNPEGEGYDRYWLETHDKSAGLIKNWCDLVLFAQHEEWAAKLNKAPTARAVGKSSGERVLRTQRTAAWDAKNRYNLPPTLPLDWSALSEAMEAFAVTPVGKLRAQIDELLAGVDDELAAKVLAFVEEKPGDASHLARALNRLQVVVSQQQQETAA
jgi:hypothetical protein